MSKRSFLAVAWIAVLGMPLLQGQATLHIGFGAGTPCAMGCGGEPNLSGSGGSSVIDIFQNQGGAGNITNPLLLLAIPNDTTNLNFTITGETDINPYPGGTSTAGSGAFLNFTPNFNAGSGADVYSFVGLGGSGSKSDNFGNLQSAELAKTGINATSFGIYEFTINTVLGPKGLANITFSSPLPLGAYAFGSGGKFDTPFTESGLINGTPAATPEPGAIVLLSTCLAFLIFSQRQRLRPRV